MTSSLFTPNNQMNNPFQMLSELSNFMSGKNPQLIFNTLLNGNPKFAEFVSKNKGKSIEQIASDYGVDINAIKPFISK